MMNFVDHGAAATLGMIFGSLLSTLIRSRQKKIELEYSEADSIRQELRQDVALLRQNIDKITLDLDLWKDKYYRLADENMSLRSRCKVLEMEVEELRRKITLAAATPQTQESPPLALEIDIQRQ